MDHWDDAATGPALKKGEMNYNPGECLFWINIFEDCSPWDRKELDMTKWLSLSHTNVKRENLNLIILTVPLNCTLQKWLKAPVYKNSSTTTYLVLKVKPKKCVKGKYDLTALRKQ